MKNAETRAILRHNAVALIRLNLAKSILETVLSSMDERIKALERDDRPWYDLGLAKEHSKESILRRIMVIREALLVAQKEIEKGER